MTLDDLKLDTSKDTASTSFQAPTNLDRLDPNKWGGEVAPSKLAIQANAENVRAIPGLMNEGVRAGSDAAQTLFSQNMPGISSAIASRAKRQLTRSESQRGITNQMKGFAKSRMAIGEAASEQAQMWKLRRANFQGQLEWADQVANYNQAMETTKLSLIGSIFSGAGAIAGAAIAGPGGAIAGSQAGKVLS